MSYQLYADLVLLLHFAIVAFVVGGLVCTLVGNLRSWDWVNGLWFRLAHLGAVLYVAAQAWFGATCPLTALEMALRVKARALTYRGSFIEHWLARLLYYEAPAWVFTLAYTLFALLVVLAWWRFPPKTRHRSAD